jgi:hypothetical protein
MKLHAYFFGESLIIPAMMAVSPSNYQRAGFFQRDSRLPESVSPRVKAVHPAGAVDLT